MIYNLIDSDGKHYTIDFIAPLFMQVNSPYLQGYLYIDILFPELLNDILKGLYG